MGKGNRSLEHTPTWAVSIFALFFFLLSFVIDAALHALTKFLRKRKRKSLNRALDKSKTEMMKLGLISLLLTVSEVPISNICVTPRLANSFLPCQEPLAESDAAADDYCQSRGMVSLVSREGIFQLNMFISILAVFHVLYCLATMFLGMAKMKKWKAWEDETRTLEYQILNDPRRFQCADQTSFGKRHLNSWSKYPVLLAPACLVRQFSGSAISKIDYFTLRNGFITANFAEGSNFNFHKFLARAYDDDFEQVVGVRFWIWIFCILFIFFSAHMFFSHYWLTMIPLVIIVVVGTKLQLIITKLGVKSLKQKTVIQGSIVVKPNDDLFWFGRPDWILHLLQFVLIQNSFQLAFFTWTWLEYGQRSCFHRATEDISITISLGVIVQIVCGYVTLPLYALVTQMGSGMKTAVFTDTVVKSLRLWLITARRNLDSDVNANANANATDRPDISLVNSAASASLTPTTGNAPTPPPSTSTVATTTTPSVPLGGNPKAAPRGGGAYDGEISFGSSWKTTLQLQMEMANVGVGAETEITSIVELDEVEDEQQHQHYHLA